MFSFNDEVTVVSTVGGFPSYRLTRVSRVYQTPKGTPVVVCVGENKFRLRSDGAYRAVTGETLVSTTDEHRQVVRHAAMREDLRTLVWKVPQDCTEEAHAALVKAGFLAPR